MINNMINAFLCTFLLRTLQDLYVTTTIISTKVIIRLQLNNKNPEIYMYNIIFLYMYSVTVCR